MKSAINSMIFDKQFRLTPSTRGEYGPGQVFGVMQNDTAGVVDYTFNILSHIMMPIELI